MFYKTLYLNKMIRFIQKKILTFKYFTFLFYFLAKTLKFYFLYKFYHFSEV